MVKLHLLMAVLAIMLFCYQSFIVLTSDKPLAKGLKIASHILYLALMITGALLVIPLLTDDSQSVQWAFAKLVILLAVISTSVKAFKDTADKNARKMGILLASFGLIGIVFLAMTQPNNLF